MDERRSRMAGPFVPMPGEVLDLLRTLDVRVRRVCLDTYVYMLKGFTIEQDPEVEGEWVMGRIRATHREIANEVGVNWSWFQKKVWPALAELGLVRDASGRMIELPRLYKKGQSYIIPLEMTKQLNDVRAEIRAIKETLALLVVPTYGSKEGEKPPEWRSKTSKLEVAGYQNGIRRIPATSSLKDLKKEISLSGNSVISGFYRGIGQEKISKVKRERGNGILRKLKEDGFTLEDIAFAVEWTLKNAKEQPYDFSILEHTIGQAMAAKEKEAAREAKRREAESIRAKERAEEEEKERIEAYKESLPPGERTALRERAEREIRESGEFDEDFITDYLIGIKENEILRKEIAEKKDEDQENNV